MRISRDKPIAPVVNGVHQVARIRAFKASRLKRGQ
jgi:hypothetical protein